MREPVVRILIAAAIMCGAATMAAADVVEHECTIAVYTSGKRLLELRQERREAVTERERRQASDELAPLAGWQWQGTMVWRDGLERVFPFQGGVLILQGWFNGTGDLVWDDRKSAPVGFRVGTNALGHGGTPIEAWLPREAVAFTIRIADPARTGVPPSMHELFAGVERLSGSPAPRDESEQRGDASSEPGLAGPAGLVGGLAGGAGVLTAGEIVVVGSGILAAAKAIIAGSAAAGAGAATATEVRREILQLSEYGLKLLEDGVSTARDVVRKHLRQDGTERAKVAAKQLEATKEFRLLPELTQSKLIRYVSDSVRRESLKLLGEHIQNQLVRTDANIARIAELASEPGNTVAQMGLARLNQERALYQLILDEQRLALSNLAPNKLALQEAAPIWRSYPKHLPSRQLLSLSRASFAEATRGAPALYLDASSVEQLEVHAWKHGVTTNAGNTEYRVFRFDHVIGASDGQLTPCVKVEVTAGVLHGHPVPEHICDRVFGAKR